MILLIVTISALSIMPFYSWVSCGSDWNIPGRLIDQAFESLSAMQSGFLTLLSFLRLYTALQIPKVDEFRLRSSTKIFFGVLHILYWLCIFILWLNPIFPYIFHIHFLLIVVLLLVFVILMISTSVLFCYKMCSIIRVFDADDELIEIKRTIKRFAILFGISIFISLCNTIITGFTHSVDDESEHIFYLHLLFWIFDIYTNAICTVLTYKGAGILPTKQDIVGLACNDPKNASELEEYQTNCSKTQTTSTQTISIHSL